MLISQWCLMNINIQEMKSLSYWLKIDVYKRQQLRFMKKNVYTLSFTEYEKIDEKSKPLNIYVSGPKKVNKHKMYNYDYIGQLTMMYNVKKFGTIQIKDIRKNNDYAIRLQLYKKPETCAYLLKENLAKYRVRKDVYKRQK